MYAHPRLRLQLVSVLEKFGDEAFETSIADSRPATLSRLVLTEHTSVQLVGPSSR